MRGLAGIAVATLVIPALVLGTPAAQAAGCTALDYQAGVAAAAAALQTSPPQVAVASSTVSRLQHDVPTAAASLQPVADDLAARPPDLVDAQLRLAATSSALAHPSGSTCNADTGAARAALHDVYATPAFRNLDQATQPGLLDAVRNFIGRLVSGAAGALGPAGAALLIVAVLGIGVLLAWRRWHGSSAVRGAVVDDTEPAGDDPDAEWRLALLAAAGGDHREAVRRAFRSALIEVAVRGDIHIEPAWTTRELLEHARADGAVLGALAPAAALFERAWYGGRPVSRDDWEHASERCMSVRRAARVAGVSAR